MELKLINISRSLKTNLMSLHDENSHSHFTFTLPSDPSFTLTQFHWKEIRELGEGEGSVERRRKRK